LGWLTGRGEDLFAQRSAGVTHGHRRQGHATAADFGGNGLENRVEDFRVECRDGWGGHALTIIANAMKRSELISRTRRLIEEGDRLQVSPSMPALRVWLQLSDELLSAAWGQMDRYHLSWLMVGRPDSAIRGRSMTAVEEADYVREVAAQKTAALRMSLRAVDEQNMPFVGETREDAPAS
jgi:hypothetical protein